MSRSTRNNRANVQKPGVSCGECEEPGDSRMVCCDDCGEQFHFKCVGVEEGIEEVDWSCKACEAKRAAQVNPAILTDPALGGAGKSSSDNQHQQNQLLVDVQKKMQMMQRSFEEQQLAYEKMLEEKDREMKNALEDLQHQYQRRLERKEQEIRDELTAPPAVVLPSANSTSIGADRGADIRTATDVCSVIERVEKQLQAMAKKQEQETKRLEERLRAMEIGNNDPGRRSSSALNIDADPFEPSHHSGLTSVTLSHELSRSQLAARHAVAKELPIFCGSPEEWPLFIATYESTSKMCGFSDEENLLRLQRSLKGKALEAVRSRLLYPAGLQGVISTLRMLFGRPEVIVHSLVCKIREMPAPRTEKLGTRIDFGVAVQNMCATIVACGLNEHLCNVALLQELVEKLPPTVKLDWAKYRQPLQSITLSDFSTWLGTLVEAACVVTVPPTISTYAGKPDKRRKEEVHVHLETGTSQASNSTVSLKIPPKHLSKQCVICQGTCSSVVSCKKFKDLSIGARWEALKQNRLCRKCLMKHFGACSVKEACGRNGCAYMHHEMLHDDARYQRKQITQPSTSSAGTETPTESCNTHMCTTNTVLFRYVPVLLYGKGKTVLTFAFLDDGSSVTLMEHGLLTELGLEGESYPLCLGWTADHQRQETNSVKLAIQISGIHDASTYWIPKVHTVESLALPSQTLAMDELMQRYQHLEGLIVESYRNIQPRLLIGMDNCRLGHALDSREGEINEPIATNTRLGWIVFGPCATTLQSATDVTAHHSFHPRCKELESCTHVRGKRYETGLLWRYDDVRLPDSRPMAIRRLICLEKRMQRDQNLAEALKQKIRDYECSGYIEKLTDSQLSNEFPRIWYLPIFPVVNPNKPGKLRLVWDAAAKVAGISLNSFLLTGPDQLTSLPSVLHRFREFRIAVTGDIREMFHQVLVNESDQQCQRFLWRDGEQNRNPDVYVMKVMTFGATCSPSCAQYVKNNNAQRFQEQYPRAAEAIVKEHYVDDMLSSEETEEDAVKLAKEVRELEATPGEKSLNLSSEMGTEKVLGMWWCTSTDTFTFKVSPRISADLLQGRIIPTKRQILSTLMMIFDPLGLLANFLMFLKILLQEIWRSGVNWDEQIKPEQCEKWNTWLRVLPQVEEVSVSRCYRVQTGVGENNVIQLHVFVDASEKGFAAVAFLRFEEDGIVECALIGAKTRVAPLRFVSIPRLELQAAVIGARLANDVMETHKLKPSQRFFWSDSRDVLCWLNSDHRRYSQFVAVRQMMPRSGKNFQI
ncbi:uncharacterized protein LOC109398619 [Aedes albopictus]|uniref:PHD-type domain-containing protein n=1 Tax=Aedes albopictus TaxID=7160 RepID=A0ABM1ZIZ4_AEDAL